MTPNPKPVVNAAHPAQTSFTALVTLLASFRTGIRTTEFWVSLIAVIMPPILALLDKLPASTAGIITGLCALGYHILRGTQKSSQADALLNGLRTIADHIIETPQEKVLGGDTEPAVVVPSPAPTSPAPAAATALALFALLTLPGCAQYVRAGFNYADGEKSVDVTTDGKSVRVAGGLNLNGSNVGAQVDLPLPRRNKGFAK
jgi:hypothetical protein